MTTDVMQLPRGNRISALGARGTRLPQTRHVFRPGGDLFSDLAEKYDWNEGRQTRSRALTFLLCMAAISLVRGIGDGLIGNFLLVWLGVPLDPFILSLVLQMVATLIGIGVASFFARVAPDLTTRKQMLLTILAATGIGLILAWLSHTGGYTGVCHWPLVAIYLLWAWAEAVSNAPGQRPAHFPAQTGGFAVITTDRAAGPSPQGGENLFAFNT